MTLTRRKLLLLASGAAAAPLVGGANARTDVYRWNGVALGADAEIRIAGLDHDRAARIVAVATAEVERLEEVFSLYRPTSELSRLNRNGILLNPSHDFRILLEKSLSCWSGTEGAFNPAIQPVWRFLAGHFAESATAPDPVLLHAALQHCDPSGIAVSPSRVALRPGMALTFNGIAQGYITDRAADLMRDEGMRNVLVNLGEIRALPGRPWSVGIDQSEQTIALTDGAIAQSRGQGTVFTADGRWHHLIDPRTGECPHRLRAVTVTAPTATQADALSTALFVLPQSRHRPVLARYESVRLI